MVRRVIPHDGSCPACYAVIMRLVACYLAASCV